MLHRGQLKEILDSSPEVGDSIVEISNNIPNTDPNF